MLIRPLTPEGAPAFIRLRREMLDDAPWAFASSPEDDRGLDPAFIAAQVSERRQVIVGAFDEQGILVGAAGLYRDRHIKMAHRGHVWGVFVTPAARGRGVGARVISRVLDIARSLPGITSVGLSVSERSAAARNMYAAAGFSAWGVEPAALVHEGKAYDEVHMVMFLSGQPG